MFGVREKGKRITQIENAKREESDKENKCVEKEKRKIRNRRNSKSLKEGNRRKKRKSNLRV